MKNYIWVVEIWNAEKKRWETTVGAGLTKEDALQVQRKWNNKNPNDKFRIHKYMAI